MINYTKKYKKYKKKLYSFGGELYQLRKIIVQERLNNIDIELNSPITGDNISCCIQDIGSGSYGSVSKGIDEKTGKTIIIKKIKITKGALKRASIQNNSETEYNNFRQITKNKIIEKLEKEIEIMQILNHKNIIKYLGHKEEIIDNSDDDDNDKMKDKIINIYMEDVCGISLSKISLNIGGLSLNLIELYSKQILEALNYIHSQKIIHMDIKGDNILLSNTGEIKIIDFGESIRIESHYNFFELPYSGTILFMAPEILSSKNEKNLIDIRNLGKSDIWSLGVVLVEMFVGKLYYPPDMPKNIREVYLHDRKNDINTYFIEIFMKNLLSKIENQNYDDIDISNSLINLLMDEKYSKIISFIDFIGCCLQIDYKQRWTAGKLMNHPFFDINIQQKMFSTIMNNL
jgi:serine/threonine protein kinase